MDIFQSRKAFKPYEYPEVTKFVDAINHSYWLHSELNFISDVQDFKTKLTKEEKFCIHKTLLAISQIEVKVKSFWSKLYTYIPKPEIAAVGATFSESEVRHERAYSHLLELLGLNNSFHDLLKVPEINNRLDYLNKYLEEEYKNDKRQFALSLALFTIFVENVSLFSQFAIIMSFSRHKNVLKDISNIVEWTSKEELLHGQFGIYLLNIIKNEHQSWFNDIYYDKIYLAAEKAIKAEEGILKWIISDGCPDFINLESLINFVKNRINESLVSIGCLKTFEIDQESLKNLRWFNEEIYSGKQSDFFYKRPVEYSKKNKSIQEEDLF